MRFQWDTDDIRAGRRVGRPRFKECKMIGYSSQGGGGYQLVDLQTGHIAQRYGERIGDDRPFTREELATHLSNEGFQPEEFLPGGG